MEGRYCSDCRNYCALVNQGYWWCNAGHTEDMNPETCGDYDRIVGEIRTTSTDGTFVYQIQNRHVTVIWCDWGDEDTRSLETIWEGVNDINLIHITEWNEDMEHTVNEAIRNEHDTLLVCGHGTGFGLLAPRSCSEYVIHSENVHDIVAENFVGLFCHATDFAEDYDLHGFFTGMFISNIDEAVNYSVETTLENIEDCNQLVFHNINEFLCGHITLEYLYDLMCVESETTDNELMQFNTSGIELR